MTHSTFSGGGAIPIILSDLALFTAKVKNSKVFRSVPQNSVFSVHGDSDSINYMVGSTLWDQVESISLDPGI